MGVSAESGHFQEGFARSHSSFEIQKGVAFRSLWSIIKGD